jgi:hypothetical protein
MLIPDKQMRHLAQGKLEFPAEAHSRRNRRSQRVHFIERLMKHITTGLLC